MADISGMSDEALQELGLSLWDEIDRRVAAGGLEQYKERWEPFIQDFFRRYFPFVPANYQKTLLLAILGKAVCEKAQALLPKPRKEGRYPVIQQLLSEGVTDWRVIRSRLQAINPAWVTVKKTGRPCSPKALENGFKDWLKKQRPPDQGEASPR
jgi:hypothetical protein